MTKQSEVDQSSSSSSFFPRSWMNNDMKDSKKMHSSPLLLSTKGGGSGGSDNNNLSAGSRSGNNDTGGSFNFFRSLNTSSILPSSVFSSFSSSSSILKTILGVTVTLYVLNQKHMLPRSLSSIVSKVLFYPTLPITFSRRITTWYTRMDDTVLLGGAPFSTILNLPTKLYNDHGVSVFEDQLRGNSSF